MSRTAAVLVSRAEAIRRLGLLAILTGGAGLLGLLLGLAAWGARLGLFGQPWWVLGAWGVVGVTASGLLWWGSRSARARSPAWLARELERRGFRRGALLGHLEAAAAGTSAGLLALADARQAEELLSRGPDLVAALAAPVRRGLVRGAVVLAAGLVLLGTAKPTHGAPALLWRPAEAWAVAVAPLRVRPAAAEIARGERVAVGLEAPGRRQAVLWLRAPGEGWRGQAVALDSTGRASVTVGPLESDLFLQLSSGGRRSDTVRVRLRLPAFLGGLTLTARYPRYLDLEDEPLSAGGDTIVVPAGTRIETAGEATVPLAEASWTGAETPIPLEVKGARFRGALVPRGSRIWTLRLGTASGGPIVGDTVRLPIVVVPDSAPRVDVPVPGADAAVPATLRVPVVIDVQDDHGLGRVVIESRRISALGVPDSGELEPVTLPEGLRARALLATELDLARRGLLPGDTLRFAVRVSDNAPVPHSTRSREYTLHLATLREAREAARAAAAQVGRGLDSLARNSRNLERQTGDLAHERPRPAPSSAGGQGDELRFEQARRAERVAESQERLTEDAARLREAMERLRQSAGAAGLDDPAWQEQLRQIGEQLDRALTPELRQRLAELQQALRDLDPERAREALERLAEAQQQLRENLERSRELFRRAALEGELGSLAQEARELTAEERRWASQVATLDSARAAREERGLRSRTDSLGAALGRLAERLREEEPGRPSAAGEAGEQAQQAAERMEQAEQAAARGARGEARQEGEAAARQLDPVDDELTREREALQREWRQEVAGALDQVLADAGRLAERQLEVADAMRKGQTGARTRAEEGAVEEGVSRLLDQLREVRGKNALVSEQSSVALAEARDAMRKAREALTTATPNTREAGRLAGEGIDALNAAAHALVQSRNSVEGAGSGSGLKEALEQLSAMAAQQGQLGQRSGGLLPLMGPGGALRQQLQALGAEQRALAERLERLRGGGEIPGAGDMADEARELARALESGQLDRETVQRQERLFRRMLDAGRTLEGQEEDEKRERQSTTGRDENARLPPAHLAPSEGEQGRVRLPAWEELQGLTPEERRRVVEYFRRLTEPTATAPAGEHGGRP